MKGRPSCACSTHCANYVRPLLVHIFDKRLACGCASCIVRTQMSTPTYILSILHALLSARTLAFFLSTSNGECFVCSPQRKLLVNNFSE